MDAAAQVILPCGTWPCRLIGGCSCWSWHGNHLAGFSSDLGAFACGCPRQSTCHIKKADVMLLVFWQSSDSPYGNGTCIGQHNCGIIKFETPYEHTLKTNVV